MLTAQERADRYTERWPKRPPLQVYGDALYAVWLIGNLYKRTSDCYGAYPHGLLERLLAVFPEQPRLHLFAGGVEDPGGTTFDINPDCKPDVQGDVLELGKHFPEHPFAVVLADPPYDARAQAIYGTKPFCKRRALHQVHQVLQPGGLLVWMDIRVPIWTKRQWRWGGMIALHTGTNRQIRGIYILEAK